MNAVVFNDSLAHRSCQEGEVCLGDERSHLLICITISYTLAHNDKRSLGRLKEVDGGADERGTQILGNGQILAKRLHSWQERDL